MSFGKCLLQQFVSYSPPGFRGRGYALGGLKVRVVIDIPKDFARDYAADKFKDFFSRVIADIDCNGMCCGNYEVEIAEMFLKAFDDSYVDVLGGLK